MFRTGLLTAVAGLGLTLNPRPATHTAHASDVPGALAPMKSMRDFVGGVYAGFVTDVTPDSITINGNGVQGGRPPLIAGVREFAGSDVLRVGGFEEWMGESYAYRLGDVRIGDRVNIDYNRVGGRDVCTHISIHRRPGGQVPPSSIDSTRGVTSRHHERMQALQDWEERGIPIPDKYHPCGNQAGVAPMPREVIPTIPPAKP